MAEDLFLCLETLWRRFFTSAAKSPIPPAEEKILCHFAQPGSALRDGADRALRGGFDAWVEKGYPVEPK